MAAELSGWWRQKREDLALQQRQPPKPSFMIPSPAEPIDEEVRRRLAEVKIKRAQYCTNAGFRAGVHAAAYACILTAIPTLAAVQFVPWARANINLVGQCFIVTTVSIATYFVVAEQVILDCSRKQNLIALDEDPRAKVVAP